MKIFDVIRIAVSSLKGGRAILPVIGFAIAAFCMCFAGALLFTVQEEKAQPYEIIIISEGTDGISDNDITTISAFEDVAAATPVLYVPAGISVDDYAAQLTLTGIYADYIEETFSRGGIFPDDSAMPYIILNEAACKQFSLQGNESGYDDETDITQLEWLDSDAFVQTGEGTRPVVSRIFGILSGNEEEQEPAAYISISSAKELLRQNGQDTSYTGVNVRVKNIGCADGVAKDIASMGIAVTNSTEELQSGWDTDNKEMTYLAVIGVFGLICASVLLAAWRQNALLEQAQAWETLRWIGLKGRDLRRLFAVQTVLLALLGIALGVLVALSLPSFLSAGDVEKTVFMMAVPNKAVFAGVAICVAAGLIPVIMIRQTDIKTNV